ncbi:unnamed protein product [Ectocarpus sp. CCAP 1310/34]|nr:unnamed protein product [Ectocarpus sp. CCAP 1310/34]
MAGQGRAGGTIDLGRISSFY